MCILSMKILTPWWWKRLTLCRKYQKYKKGENLKISTDELQASHAKLGRLEVTYCLSVSYKHMVCLTFSSSVEGDS